jgi:PilZ domain
MNLWKELHRRLKLGLLMALEPRRAPRWRVPALTGYYWDGFPPRPHDIRDISKRGMYIYTRERWYPGTLILIHLERADCKEGARERSISVASRVMRCDDDGVGLEFVFADQEKTEPMLAGGAEKIQFERFLAYLKLKHRESAFQQGTEADRGKETAVLDVHPDDSGVGA